MRKSFALKTEILGGDPGDVKSLKVLNRQISWKDGQIHWEADLRYVEILFQQLGMDGSSSVKTPGEKNDADKLFRYRDVDGEGEAESEETACYVDELYLKHISGPCKASAAEFYALVATASEALGLVAMTEDFLDKTESYLYATPVRQSGLPTERDWEDSPS